MEKVKSQIGSFKSFYTFKKFIYIYMGIADRFKKPFFDELMLIEIPFFC